MGGQYGHGRKEGEVNEIAITQDQWNVLGKRLLKQVWHRFNKAERQAVERYLSLCAWDAEEVAAALNGQASRSGTVASFFLEQGKREADEQTEDEEDDEAEGPEFEP
jgi:hypothetical protein